MLAAMKLQAASVLVTLGLVLSATGSPTSHPQSLQRRWLPPPLPGCTPYTPFHYVGCFIEENPTFLVYNTELDFGTMTIEICTNTCKSNGFKYAGLEYYGKCYCGTVLSVQVSDSECMDAPCNGNPAEMCGGQTARLSVYEDPTYAAPDISTPAAVIPLYTSLGCYTEPGTYRAVTFFQGQLDGGSLTTEECIATCGMASFPYAATEWSRECYCGTRLISGSVPAPSTDCSYTCTGNTNEICGGSDRLSLYHAPIFETKEPCGYTPPSTGPQCGTAYGYVDGKSTTFISLNIGNNWGWVISGTLPITGTLWMGAGGNDLTKGTNVGAFTIAKVGSNVVITYTTNPPYQISVDHFYYGATYPNHIAPGSFGHTHSFTSAVYTDSFSVPYVAADNTYIVHAGIVNPSATIACSS